MTNEFISRYISRDWLKVSDGFNLKNVWSGSHEWCHEWSVTDSQWPQLPWLNSILNMFLVFVLFQRMAGEWPETCHERLNNLNTTGGKSFKLKDLRALPQITVEATMICGGAALYPRYLHRTDQRETWEKEEFPRNDSWPWQWDIYQNDFNSWLRKVSNVMAYNVCYMCFGTMASWSGQRNDSNLPP